MNGRNPLDEGGLGRADLELLGSAERLLVFGGVNGRKPPRFIVEDSFERPMFELFVCAGRLLLLGGLKERKPPRFWFCSEEF